MAPDGLKRKISAAPHTILRDSEIRKPCDMVGMVFKIMGISIAALACLTLAANARPLLYVSSGKRVVNKYPFAGGTSCCGCTVKHSGVLPDEFPETEIKRVRFYLSGSRADSYYTRVRAGSTRLRFTLGSRSTIAPSEELSDFQLQPMKHKWRVDFTLDPPVSVGPGTPWQLLDGDNNIYSAVFVHSSDNGDEDGLPGIDEQTGCQYVHRIDARYSVRFETVIPEAPAPDRTTDEKKSPGEKRIRDKIYKTAVVEFTERGNLGIQDAGAIIAEWMTTSLNRTGAFEVYERLSLAKLTAEYQLELSGLMDEETIAEIGRIHGVQAIITGSVLKFGDIISVTAKLIEVETAKIIDSADVRVDHVNAISSKTEELAWELAID